jgi:hypothetical protein
MPVSFFFPPSPRPYLHITRGRRGAINSLTHLDSLFVFANFRFACRRNFHDLQTSTSPQMGDASGSPAGGNPQQPHDNIGGLSPMTADGRTSGSTGGQLPAQADAHFAFSNQLDMNSHPPSSRSNAYNMSSMAHVLPNVPYRGGQYHSGNQNRYQQSSASPSLMPQMGHQYGGPQSMNMGEQNYYGQQHMQQYYPTGQMPSPHGVTPMPTRQNMPYYQPQMAMNPSQAGYYYQSMGQYPTQGHGMMGQVGGQYGSPGPVGIDPRYSSNMVTNHIQAPAGQTRSMRSKSTISFITSNYRANESGRPSRWSPKRSPRTSP